VAIRRARVVTLLLLFVVVAALLSAHIDSKFLRRLAYLRSLRMTAISPELRKERDLAEIENFSGNYAAVGSGATVGGGAGATVLRNQHGIEIALLSTTQSASVGVGFEGIRLALVNWCHGSSSRGRNGFDANRSR